MAEAGPLCPSSLSTRFVAPAIYVLGVVTCALNIPMAVFTGLGNGLAIYVILRYQSLHDYHNYLLVAVAVTDVVTGLVTQPLSVITIFQKVQQNVNCDLKDVQAAFNLLCNMTSLLSLMLLSFERILAVCLPFWYGTLFSPRKLLALVVGIWLPSLLLVLSPYFHALEPKTRMRVGMIFQVISFVAIVIIALFMHRIARRHENQIAAQLQAAVPGEEQQLQLKDRKSFKTTVFILGALILCQTPVFIFSFLYRLKVLDEHAFALALWPIRTLMHLNSGLNFCIYSWRNSAIRRKIMQVINMAQNNAEQTAPVPPALDSDTHLEVFLN